VDTGGLLLRVVVHSASVQDREGAKLLLDQCGGLFPRLKHIWADGGYSGKLVDWVSEQHGWALEIVEKPQGQKGFGVLPRR